MITLDLVRRIRIATTPNGHVHHHPFCPDEPNGYVSWHEWAPRHYRRNGGARQKPCTCGVWVCLRHDEVQP